MQRHQPCQLILGGLTAGVHKKTLLARLAFLHGKARQIKVKGVLPAVVFRIAKILGQQEQPVGLRLQTVAAKVKDRDVFSMSVAALAPAVKCLLNVRSSWPSDAPLRAMS